jgi:hypothetical protein
LPLHELADGANTVLTPKPTSIFCACAKFENAATAAHVIDKRMATRNLCFNRTSGAYLLDLAGWMQFKGKALPSRPDLQEFTVPEGHGLPGTSEP